jgi:hypothetical protein
MASSSSPSCRVPFLSRGLVAAAIVIAAGCTVPPPVSVTPSFQVTDAFAARSPADVAVLPVEDGTENGAAGKLLVLLRQEVMRQLPDRLFSPVNTPVVDAALRSAPAGAAESALTPANLQRFAAAGSAAGAGDAVFALRVDRWDEGRLLTERKVWFQFQAALVASDGVQLWSGTIQGEAKAGGFGAAPRDRDGMARSCAELAVREMMLRLPRRAVAVSG